MVSALSTTLATNHPMTRANVGGKDVLYMVNGSTKGYLYVNGDTLWSVSGITDSQAAKVFAALP